MVTYYGILVYQNVNGADNGRRRAATRRAAAPPHDRRAREGAQRPTRPHLQRTSRTRPAPCWPGQHGDDLHAADGPRPTVGVHAGAPAAQPRPAADGGRGVHACGASRPARTSTCSRSSPTTTIRSGARSSRRRAGSVLVVDAADRPRPPRSGTSWRPASWSGAVPASSPTARCATSRISSTLDLPTFAAGSSPTTNLAQHHAVDLEVPIGCGEVAVYPGDVIVGDGDGVVCIPRTSPTRLRATPPSRSDSRTSCCAGSRRAARCAAPTRPTPRPVPNTRRSRALIQQALGAVRRLVAAIRSRECS